MKNYTTSERVLKSSKANIILATAASRKSTSRDNPNNLIKAGIAEHKKTSLLTPSISQEHIQSFVNGTTRGFSNGLQIAVQFLESKNELALASELKTFAQRSQDEQEKN